MEYTQLLPETRTVGVDELLDSLRLEDAVPAERPYTLVNFVASIDGRATVDGRSGPLGDEGDSAMFHGLRERVDAVMAGTGTLRAERYGRILGRAERREKRAASGRTAEPLAVIVTRSGQLPLDIPLFAEPEARVAVFSPTPMDMTSLAAAVQVEPLDPGEMTLTTVVRRLRSDHGVRLLLCEGGPTLFGVLLQEQLADELFLTVAPQLAGGRGLTIVSGAELPEPRGAGLRWLLERDGSLFLRYSLL